MLSLLHPARHDDSEIMRRVAAGDADAFATLDARHRSGLTRYAAGLLRRSEHDAEDVVQDVLIRAHQALRSGNAPDELQPWLYRLTRNRSIDEVRRKRWGDEALPDDATFAGDGREDPDAVLSRRETVRRLVEDLADLPVRQRTALLAREVDGDSAEQVAALLGVSVTAAHNLSARARQNLIKTREARDADCDAVRGLLLDAHERGARPTEHALRHSRGCDPCCAYSRDVRRLSKQLQALNPALGLPVVAGIAKLVGGGGSKLAAGVAAAVALAATGGIIVVRSEVHSPGDPAPFQLLSVRDSHGHRVTRGSPVPAGATVVTARIRVPAGPSTLPKKRSEPVPGVTLTCPKPMRYAGLEAPNRELPAYVNPTRECDPGVLEERALQDHPPRPRAPGGLHHRDRMPPAERLRYLWPVSRTFKRALEHGERRLGHVCVRRNATTLHEAPGAAIPHGVAAPSIEPGEPLALQGATASRDWTRVVIADGAKGWIDTRRLCP